MSDRPTIKKAKAKFNPELELPAEDFDGQYYWVVSPGSAKRGYYYFYKPIVVLTNHQCYSVTDLLVGALKPLSNVTVIGETTSGGSGRSQTYRLFNAQIWVKMPSMASFLPNGQLYDGRGIAPDIEHSPSLTDIEGSTDSGLDKAVELLLKDLKK